LYFHAGWAALRRGYHVLLFEGPGQSGAVNERGLRFRPDYEVPVRAAIDFVAGRPDVDPERIALLGFNWGGHFALRVAAHDQRLRAVIADAPIISLFEHMVGMNPTEVRQVLALPADQLPAMLRAQVERVVAASPTLRYYEAALSRRLGTGPLLDSFQALRAYDVGPYLRQIHAATLLIVSEAEGPDALAQARLAAERIPGASTVHVFAADEAAAQCQLDNLSGLTSVIFDWLDKIMTEDAVVAA
ncbi:MAG TPA: alpha/beta fold hydrolase, partial [Polyangia bacterium]